MNQQYKPPLVHDCVNFAQFIFQFSDSKDTSFLIEDKQFIFVVSNVEDLVMNVVMLLTTNCQDGWLRNLTFKYFEWIFPQFAIKS